MRNKVIEGLNQIKDKPHDMILKSYQNSLVVKNEPSTTLANYQDMNHNSTLFQGNNSDSIRKNTRKKSWLKVPANQQGKQIASNL